MGSAEFDHELIMRNIVHEWHSASDLYFSGKRSAIKLVKRAAAVIAVTQFVGFGSFTILLANSVKSFRAPRGQRKLAGGV
jgi:hypothetical protein